MKSWSIDCLRNLVEMAMEDYNSAGKSSNSGNSIVPWYILSKTGIAEDLPLRNSMKHSPGSRSIHFPGGWSGKYVSLDDFFFYTNSMVCSRKWNSATAEVIWQRLSNLARGLSGCNYDLDKTLWSDLKPIPFGEEAAFAFKCLIKKEMTKKLFGKIPFKLLNYYDLESPTADYLTAVHMIYFDLGKEDARKYINGHRHWSPARDLVEIIRAVENPKELSKFIESVTSSFAESVFENWTGEEARKYRRLSALHYVYPEVIENADPHSKEHLIEKLNKRLAKLISVRNLNRNWEILYILRILELIGVDLSIRDR